MNEATKHILFKRKVTRETVSLTDAAAIIGCDFRFVNELVNRGYIKTIKLGKTKVSKRELRLFIRLSSDYEIDWNAILAPEGMPIDFDAIRADDAKRHNEPVPIAKPQLRVYHASMQEG